ncbi:hypothetical protein Golomagni_06245 [Golovinomyces magnicellulatus]|nr:hypothetical protein Golomagni_06245 [Golovinomyces magnicellulatus]
MKLYPNLPDNLAEWASRQPVFFTGSASLHGKHINVSPKGQASSMFAFFDSTTCAYIDRTGSGCETVSHAYENGRLCIMFISFGSLPRILRLFCKSEVIEMDDPRFDEWIKKVSKGEKEAVDGARAIIVGHIWQVQTSCGYGVPRVKRNLYKPEEEVEGEVAAVKEKKGIDMDDELDELSVFEERPNMDKWNGSLMVDDKANKYRSGKNGRSLDGLPGLRATRKYDGEWLWAGDTAVWFKRMYAERAAVGVGFMLAVLLYCVLEYMY